MTSGIACSYALFAFFGFFNDGRDTANGDLLFAIGHRGHTFGQLKIFDEQVVVDVR
ncbi:MAG: hypothetical protein R3E58_21200 [Phycisphaerae bacterium]